MKKYFLPLLVLMPCVVFSNTNIDPLKAANIIVNDLKKRATKSNGSFYINNKPILLSFSVWTRRLQTTFENCDEYSLYVNSPEFKRDCYTEVIKGYESWLEATQDPNISMQTWYASLSAGTIGNTVDFNHWVSMIRVYGARYGDGVKKPSMPDGVERELNIYKEEQDVIRRDIRKEHSKGVFKNNKKLNTLLAMEAELRKKIETISNQYETE